jgi:phosphoglycerol transferase
LHSRIVTEYRIVRTDILLIAALACAALAACGESGNVATKTTPAAPASAPASTSPAAPGTLAEGIVFSKAALPDFVARTDGIAQAEAFGRWTDGAKAVIEFKQPLPTKFDLIVEGAAYGPNVAQPIVVSIGSAAQDLVFAAEMGKGTETKRLAFTLDQPANRIELKIPRPTRPQNGDLRELGIALITLKIESAAR